MDIRGGDDATQADRRMRARCGTLFLIYLGTSLFGGCGSNNSELLLVQSNSSAGTTSSSSSAGGTATGLCPLTGQILGGVALDSCLLTPSEVTVSAWSDLGKVVVEWAPPSYDATEGLSLVVERDAAGAGWHSRDTIEGSRVSQGFWVDSSITSAALDHDLSFRLFTRRVPTGVGADTVERRSRYSTVVGVLAPLDTAGLVVPTGLSGCWVNARDLRVSWSDSGVAFDIGWLLEAGNGVAWVPQDTLAPSQQPTLLEDLRGVTLLRLASVATNGSDWLQSEYSLPYTLGTKCENLCYAQASCGAPTSLALDTATSFLTWTQPSAYYDCQQIRKRKGSGELAPYPATCGATLDCRMVTDPADGASATTAPCWSMAKSSQSELVDAMGDSLTYWVRGVALNQAGTQVWEASAWSDSVSSY